MTARFVSEPRAIIMITGAAFFILRTFPRRSGFHITRGSLIPLRSITPFIGSQTPRPSKPGVRQAPKGFCYALKFSRYGSHIVRLKKPRDTIGKFLKRADRLGEFLGPILVQLPPNWKADPERLAAFLKAAPKKYRWVLEFRDRRWLCQEVFAILSEHGSAMCIHDMIDDHPRLVTAGWVYLRFHGKRYSGSYSSEKLRAEARWIKQQLAGGKDVFAYFNNDAQGYAVANAIELKRYIDK